MLTSVWGSLEVKQLNDLLHVADLVWEELDHSLVATHFTKLAENYEECLDFSRDVILLCTDCLANIELQELHDWRDQVV